MKALKKVPEECSSGMRQKSTLLLAPAASMSQLKRLPLDNVFLDSLGQLPLLIGVGQ